MEDTPEPYSVLPLINSFLTGSEALHILPVITLFIILLLISGLLSGAGTAFFSLSGVQIDLLMKSSSPNSRFALRLLESPRSLKSTLILANILVNIVLAISVTLVFANLIYQNLHPLAGFVLLVLFIGIVILVFGEILPKGLALKRPVLFVRLMAIPVWLLRKLFWPFSRILDNTSAKSNDQSWTNDSNHRINDLTEVFDQQVQRVATEEDRSILRGIVRFGNLSAREIMRPRVDVTAVEVSTPFSKLLPVIVEAGYSRVPVFRESFDNVEGILYIKDLLSHREQDDSFAWQKLLRPCYFVPESKRISDLLKEFKEKKIHLAIVVDEYGGTAGIVTLEDILEEIVGEINDEFDTDENIYSKLDPNTFDFEGKTLLKDFCKITGTDYELFEEIKGEADTLAGLILEMKQELPRKGEKLHFRNFEFQVEGVDARRIKRVKVTILPMN
ncbi:MAG TPA: gliding motility-associated protein GldE [Bacteroidales bacterium]|nr:gliding motility-associated protein GldE [Bacteroidales bacterium]